MKQKLATLFFMAFFPLAMVAYDCEVDGIYYKLDNSNNTASVTYKNSDYNSYSGSIDIPSSFVYNGTTYTVTSIGSAFYKCSGLTSVTIPSSVTSIEGWAFDGCSGLKKVIVNDIANWCKISFSDLSSNPLNYAHHLYSDENHEITELVIPNSVTSIGDYAFYGCSGLTSVTIPESVTSIGRSAFSGCSGLTSVTIPNSVTSIGDYAFYDCSSLTSIDIPESVTSIGMYAFNGCVNLSSIIIPPNVTVIRPNTFENCSGLTSVDIHNNLTVIGAFAFKKCSGLISVNIPNSVTAIGGYAFNGCTSLTSVDISNSQITYVGDYTFAGCSSLTSVTIPNSVTSIGNSAFYGCSSLTSVTIPESVTSIGDDAFLDCSSLTSVTIPESVTSIGVCAFNDCSNLTKVDIASSIIDIKEHYGNYDLFRGCDNLSTIEFHCETIVSQEWFKQMLIMPIVMGDEVKSIDSYAFQYCERLPSVTIGNSVTSIGNSAFYGCEALTSITVASENTKYDSRDNCNAIIETSSNTLVVGCKNTTIPSSVTSIGGRAFYNCSGLTSVTIPNSVTSIGNYAFQYCSSLTSVTVENPTPITISSDVFSNRGNATLYVPVGSKGAYEAANYWKDFKEIIEIVPSPAITFADNAVKTICVANWDTNHDGELSMAEAAAVTELGEVFKGNEEITSFDELQYFTGLTSIEKDAFAGCTNLTSVTIPNSVESIGEQAFSRCSGLTTVTIPNSVTSIAIAAFSRCSGLTSITIPESVTSIMDDAFSRCSGLTSVTIPESVTSIGTGAFSGCEALTSVTIPNSVTSIGNGAFMDCSGLTSVTIPNSVTSIGRWVFSGCSGLTSITIPNSVTSIEEQAFSRCSGLTSVTIPNSVTSIASYAFEDCSGLTSITIPESVTSIMDDAFSGCSGLTSMKVESGNTIYDSRNNCNAIIETSSNTLISGCINTTIPNSVTSIGRYAFFNCSGLTSVTIPNSVTSIGGYVFYGCSSLTSVTVENPTPITISSGDFPNCKNATLYVPAGSKAAYEAADYWKDFKEIIEIDPSPAITFADNAVKTICVANWDTNHDGELSMAEAAAVTELGELFKGNEEITSFDELQYFTGLTSIEKDAFAGCTNLTSVTIPNSVTSIGDFAFMDCSGLTSVTIPNSVTSIGNGAFHGCKALTSITIPNNVTSIGDFAFYNCKALTSVTIPESVTSIGGSAFFNCKALTSITIPNSVTSIGDYAFYGCKALTSVTIPESVTSIGRSAFMDCSGLTSVTIPSSVTSIGIYAFSDCSGLTSITIPESVTSIGGYAFYGCSSLTSVTVENPTPITITSDVFPNRGNATLYVPVGSKGAYEAANYWKDFKEIIEEEQIDENNRLYADDATGRSGATVIIPLMLKTEAEYAGMQCVVKLSDGFTLNKVTRTNRVPTNDIIQSNSIGNNEYQLLVYSTNRETFAGNDGALVELHVAVDNTVEDGAYTMQFSDIHVSDVDMNIKDLASAHSNITISNTLLIGDVNNDGKVLVNDIMGVANYILKIPMQNFNEKAADVDGDGRILVNDIMGIANIILKINTQSSNKAPRMEDSLDPQ